MLAIAQPIRRAPARRRGLTILEVVIALALLALAAGMVGGALSMLQSMRERAQYKLAATEAAHRLVLQFNENRGREIDNSRPIEVDGYVFDFDVVRSVVDIQEFAGTARVEPSLISFDDLADDPMQAVYYRLWHVEANVYARGEAMGFQSGQRVASVSRVYDFLAGDTNDMIDMILEMFSETIDQS